MCSTDGEYPDVYNAVDRTARKAHQCAECGRAINAGEIYSHAFMLFRWHLQHIQNVLSLPHWAGMVADELRQVSSLRP